MSVINYLTTIHLAPGSIALLRTVLDIQGMRRPLLVTDAGMRRSRAYPRVLVQAGPDTSVYSGTPSNPTEQAVEEALATYRKRMCDGVIAYGGGSAIDLAKAVALLATHPEPLPRYALIDGGMAHITAAVAPIIAIPTTAGTGSEVGRASLVTLRDGRKLAIASSHLIPRCAICDPELTLSLPPNLTAATGMDALTHCIESFLSPASNPVADAIALDGAARAFRYIEAATANGADLEARLEMMTASLMGGLSFQKGLGSVHALSHSLGAIKEVNLHHGTLNAVLLPPVLRANEPHAAAKYPRLASAMGLHPDSNLANEIEALNARLGITSSLATLGVTAAMVPRVVQGALRDHTHLTNPFQPSEDEYTQILAQVMP